MITHEHADGPARCSGTSVLPSTIHVHCLHCEYNLTGTVEPRCPECGEPFDRTWLDAWFAGRDSSLRSVVGDGRWPWWSLFSASLFEPSRIGRCLSPGIRWTRMLMYTEAARLLAVAIGLLLYALCLLELTDHDWKPIFLICLAGYFGSLFCECLLAVALGVLVTPHFVDSHRRLDFWVCLVRCFVGHLCITIMLIAAGLVLMIRGYEFLWWVMLLGIPWWYWCLSRAIAARATSAVGAALAVVAIPVAAAISIVAALMFFSGFLPGIFE